MGEWGGRWVRPPETVPYRRKERKNEKKSDNEKNEKTR